MTGNVFGSLMTDEEFNLFNSAFVAAILIKAVEGASQDDNTGLDFPLAFIVPGLVLQRNIRLLLPSRTNSSFINWVKANPNVRAQYPSVAKSLVAVTKSGINWAIAKQALALSGELSLTTGDQQIVWNDKIESLLTSEVIECFAKAHFLGRWMKKMNSTKTVYALLGVRP